MADSSVDADVDNRPQEEGTVAALEALEQRCPTCLPEEEEKPYIGQSNTSEPTNDNDDDASDEDDTNNDQDEDADDVSSSEESGIHRSRIPIVGTAAAIASGYIHRVLMHIVSTAAALSRYIQRSRILAVAAVGIMALKRATAAGIADLDMAKVRASIFSNNFEDDGDDDGKKDEAMPRLMHVEGTAAASSDILIILMAPARTYSNKDEATLLSLVKKGRLQNVKQLLESKPHLIQAKTSEGETILHLAAAKGHHDTVKHLLRLITSKKSKYKSKIITLAKSCNGDSVLHAAAQSGHIDMVKHLVRVTTMLLKYEIIGSSSRNEAPRPPMLEANHYGDTPVHVALIKGHIEVAWYLIQKQPQVAYVVNLDSESPLFLAVKGNHQNLVEDLFKVLPGKDVDKSLIKRIARPLTPIVHEALNTRNIAMLQILLKNIPALINSKDKRGWTPLSYAAYKGYYEEVVYFLKNIPKCEEQRNGDGSFPIHKAARGDQVNVLNEFLSLRPDTIYQKTKGGRTILDIAHRHRKQKTIDYLNEHHTQEPIRWYSLIKLLRTLYKKSRANN